MAITNILEGLAQAPKTPKGKSVKGDVDGWKAAMNLFDAAGVRISYGANAELLSALGCISPEAASIPTAGIRFLDLLPVEKQFLVCKSSGGYHPTALGKWARVAPVGFESRPIVDKGQVFAALDRLEKAAKEAAAKVKPEQPTK